MVNPLHDVPAIGQRLRLAWKASGLTQREFFRRANIAPNTGNQYVQGVERPLLENAIRLCEIYNLTLDYIYRGDPSGLRYEMRDAIATLRHNSK
jgi:transcriptional regulator with XRE-family HTH domain